MIPGYARARPTPVPAAMPDKPADVGCPPACGLYRPGVHACLDCLDAATGVADSTTRGT